MAEVTVTVGWEWMPCKCGHDPDDHLYRYINIYECDRCSCKNYGSETLNWQRPALAIVVSTGAG